MNERRSKQTSINVTIISRLFPRTDKVSNQPSNSFPNKLHLTHYTGPLVLLQAHEASSAFSVLSHILPPFPALAPSHPSGSLLKFCLHRETFPNYVKSYDKSTSIIYLFMLYHCSILLFPS